MYIPLNNSALVNLCSASALTALLLPLLGFEINFKKLPADWIDSRDVAYDYGSIMHYPRTIFGKSPWDETVVPLDATAQVGQRIKLSDPDILQAKKLYSCPG